MAGSMLGASAGICTTMQTAAGKSRGRERASSRSASTPPAEAPTTTRSRVGMAWELQGERRALAGRAGRSEVAAHEPRQLAADREAESDAVRYVARHRSLHERLEDALEVRRPDT